MFLSNRSPQTRQYMLVTASYWAFTLTDGALRMLVILHFHGLGYSPLEISMLFLFYEFFGVVTNLVGGWLGAHLGLNKTMNIGLAIQVLALGMLLVPASVLSIAWVMAAQALSGIAKDLNKMSAKSSVKLLLPSDAQGRLYKWVALLTGSKNALKGAGFFLGGALLSLLGFKGAIAVMAVALALVWVFSMVAGQAEFGVATRKPKFSEMLSKSPAINALSGAKMFLFCARDVWFVVALPVYLTGVLGWDYWWVSSALALWIIGYGIVQSLAPYFTGARRGRVPDGVSARLWAGILATVPAMIALGLAGGVNPQWVLVGGLMVFGALFAINSSLHSYLIIAYAKEDRVSLDIGFYYMANAAGRLLGTVLSGWIYQLAGLEACLWLSMVFLLIACAISTLLPRHPAVRA